jgi:glutamyl-tRNA synthetase
MIAAFDLPAIGRSPARFDFTKLESLNGHYIRATPDADVMTALENALPHIAGGEELTSRLTPVLRAKMIAAMPGLKERAKTLIELLDGARFLWAARPLDLDDKAKALLTPEARQLIGQIVPKFEGNSSWDAASTEADVRSFVDQHGLKLGNIAQPLRAALTGRTTSPPIFDVLTVLGKEESLARLRDQIG